MLAGQSTASSELVDENVSWFKIWVWATVAIYLINLWLDVRQLKQFYLSKVPASIEKHVTQEQFDKCQKYSLAKQQFKIMKDYFTTAFKVLLWTMAWPAMFWEYTAAWSASKADPAVKPMVYDFYQALLLMGFFIVLGMAINYPFDMISKFLIEEQHGFNKQSFGGWVKDHVLALIIQVVLMPPVIYVILWIIAKTGDNFVLYLGVAITFIYLIFMVLIPIVIMPMFNKYDQIEENNLKKDIQAVASEVEYPLSKVEVIDGSKRSGHSNAFQYGFGKIKKVVIFDTLLDQHLGLTEEAKERDATEQKEAEAGEEGKEAPAEKKQRAQSDFNYDNYEGRVEILSIVAHELGHWGNNDVMKMSVYNLVYMYIVFFIFKFVLQYTDMTDDFGFASNTSVFIKLYLFIMLLAPVNFFEDLVSNFMVRQIEYNADRYSVDLGYGLALQDALIKVHVNNSANLVPDWIFSIFRFNHPPLVERLNAIDAAMCQLTETTAAEEAKQAYAEKFTDTLAQRHNHSDAIQGDQMEGGACEEAGEVAVQKDRALQYGKFQLREALLK